MVEKEEYVKGQIQLLSQELGIRSIKMCELLQSFRGLTNKRDVPEFITIYNHVLANGICGLLVSNTANIDEALTILKLSKEKLIEVDKDISKDGLEIDG